MKYSIDKTLMDVIDTEAKAYWLGFLYADGFNYERKNQVVIELAVKDRDHLIKCAKFFGSPRDPFLQPKNKGKYMAYRLELNSSYLTKALRKNGCHQTKSLSLIFPDWLPKNLTRHFVRGYFDGDGSIYIHQDQLGIEIVSTPEFNLIIQNLLKEQNINSQIRYREKFKGNTVVLYSGGSRQIIRFCKWLYDDATVYMDRKYNVYKQYTETHSPRFTT